MSEWTRPEEGKAALSPGTPPFAPSSWHCSTGACAPITARLADLLPPARFEVVYSGVISADAPADAAALAKRMARLGIRQIKVKVGTTDDAARLEAVRKAVGVEVELRADANGAWSADEAIEQSTAIWRTSSCNRSNSRCDPMIWWE